MAYSVTSTEHELLILCADPRGTAYNRVRIEELLDLAPDWNLLENAAGRHRVLPLLYRALEEVRPSAVQPGLAAEFRAGARKSLLLTAELDRILDLLKHAGITAVPFKGPELARIAYGDVVLRCFDDLDLLVSRADLWRAAEVLTGDRYVPEVKLSPHRRQDLLDSYDELVLRGSGGAPLIELHWRFLPPYFSVPLDAERAMPSLSKEDLLLVLAFHAAKHCWSRLGMAADFAALMARGGMDWDAVLAEARRVRGVRMLLLAVTLCARLFGTPVPCPLEVPCASDPKVAELADGLRKQMFGPPWDEAAIVPAARLHLKMREDARDRMTYVWRLATRPGFEDWHGIDLPPRLSFLYRLLRVPRLIRKYFLPRKVCTIRN